GASMSLAFPFYTARGSARALGRQHGEQCRTQVRGFLDYLGHSLRLSREELRRRASCFLPLFEEHCPHLVEEVRGLADGAGVPFLEALSVQIRGELAHSSGEGCTTFVIAPQGTKARQVLI